MFGYLLLRATEPFSICKMDKMNIFLFVLPNRYRNAFAFISIGKENKNTRKVSKIVTISVSSAGVRQLLFAYNFGNKNEMKNGKIHFLFGGFNNTIRGRNNVCNKIYSHTISMPHNGDILYT